MLFLLLVTHEEEGYNGDDSYPDTGHGGEASYDSLENEGEEGVLHRLLVGTVPHLPHSDGTVIASLVVSFIAIGISFFNLVMLKPNIFDPLVLQLEFKRRQEENKQKHFEEKKKFS
jgi:hypothetical protein